MKNTRSSYSFINAGRRQKHLDQPSDGFKHSTRLSYVPHSPISTERKEKNIQTTMIRVLSEMNHLDHLFKSNRPDQIIADWSWWCLVFHTINRPDNSTNVSVGGPMMRFLKFSF